MSHRGSPADGVTKFQARHHRRPLEKAAMEVAPSLLVWRNRLFALGGLGQDPLRYDGAGFGNVSQRLAGDTFVITGTQTQGKETGLVTDLSEVLRCDVVANTVTSAGPTAPSSESMTHAAIYGTAVSAHAVMHIHSPAVFTHAARLGLAIVPASVAYGTENMALATAALVQQGRQAFVMLGHPDGVVVWGPSLDAVGAQVESLLQQSRT